MDTEPYLPSFSHTDSCDRYYADEGAADDLVVCVCGATKAQVWLNALLAERRDAETALRDAWATIHRARHDHVTDGGDVTGPNSFYAGVLHGERIIEHTLGFRPGSLASDPQERATETAGPCLYQFATDHKPCGMCGPDSTGESQAVHCTLQRGHDGAHAGLVLWVAEHG